VGREEVFLAIENFLTDGNQNCGYFIIEAKPGIGKSTILAEYVRRKFPLQNYLKKYPMGICLAAYGQGKTAGLKIAETAYLNCLLG
jgi:hypothetical protein